MVLLKKFLFNMLRSFFLISERFINVQPKRILFTSFNGKGYFCNPKYICEQLEKQGPYDIIWVLNEEDVSLKTRTVRFMSLEYLYFYLSSKVIVTNQGFKSFIPKPNDQVRIETWHGGGAYKKTDLAIVKDKFLRYKYEVAGKDIDYYVSSCESFSKIMSYAQCVELKKFLSCGMPRNDILFNKKYRTDINMNVRKQYAIGEKMKVILYAPTWRDDGRSLEVDDLCRCIQNLNKVENQYCLLYRAHLGDNLKCNFNDVIDVSDYPDMQELLCAADILITDYSSCMWDFSLMYKPCFIFATDIAKYKQERDFYTPMSEWPFPIASNNEELVNNILNFNEADYIEKVKQHHKALGSYEDGHACERVCKLIEEICNDEK